MVNLIEQMIKKDYKDLTTKFDSKAHLFPLIDCISPFRFMAWPDICSNCKNRFFCLIHTSEQCPGFTPIGSLQLELVEMLPKKEIGDGPTAPVQVRLNTSKYEYMLTGYAAIELARPIKLFPEPESDKIVAYTRYAGGKVTTIIIGEVKIVQNKRELITSSKEVK